MIAPERFDADLDRFEQELAQLEQITVTATPAQQRMQGLYAKLKQIEQQHDQLMQMIEHCRFAEATELPMVPTARAILFWAREWSDRVEDFQLRYADYLDKLLWLNLLRGRLLGRKNPFRLDIADTDVQAFLQKKQSLEQTEITLQEELKELQTQETKLRQQYQRFQFEESNRLAAQSFASFHRTLGSQRPTFDAFGRFLRTLGVHMSHSHGQLRKTQQLAVNFTKRSQNLLEECSALLRQDPLANTSQKRRDLRLMQQNLAEMKRLEGEIETTLAALSPLPHHRSALRVKKASRPTIAAFLEHPLDRTDAPFPKG
jgi:cell division septum initiation protein DivIVA